MANNASWLILDKVIKIVLGILVGAWVARYLGPAQFAKLNLSTVFVGLFTPLATLSIDSIVVRELSRHPANRAAILGSAFVLRLIASVFSFIAILCISWLLYQDDMELFYMVAMLGAVLIFQSTDIIDLFFQSILKSKYTIYARSGSYIIITGIKVALILMHASLMAFAVAYFAELALGSLGLILIYIYRKEKISAWKVNFELCKAYISNSSILIVQSFALVAQTKVDQIIMEQTIGSEELGQYSVAIRLIELLAFLPLSVYTSVAPRIAEAKVKSEELYQHKLGHLYRVMFYIFVISFIGIAVAGHPFVSILYGQQYHYAGYLFSLLGIRLLFTNMGLARSAFLLNENMFRFGLASVILGSVLNIGLNLLLIPMYQSIGAIISTIISFTCSTFLIDLFFVKTRQNLRFMFISITRFKDGFN